MAKLALLIGVSDYGADITSLLAAIKDVEAMQRVLLNPEMGGFAETDVTALKNPDRQEVEEAIYRLFANRQREDLLLFYFSGHGIKDENGKLYLSNCNTRKENGRLVKPSALAASVLNENMNESKSERQVVILDCCFSGAIARDMIPRDDSTVNLQEELGGKGRAILTSSTSTQYAFEQEGLELSVYTRYLVEGIEKGAADKDGDGRISVDELHEYASIKVKQEAPAMTPKIYPVEEGYKIYIAKAPKGDPKLIYRKLVQELAKEGSGEIHELDRITLEVKQESLQLTLEDTKSIEAEVLKPYQEYKRKLHKYEEAFYKARESDSNLNEKTRTKLKRLQELLVLGDDDINPIEARICEIQPSKIIGHKDEDTAKIEAIISDEQPTTPPRRNPQLTRNRNFLYYIIGTCTIGVIGVVIGANVDLFRKTTPVDKPILTSCAKKETYNLDDSISLGEEILVKPDKPDINLHIKEAGIQAFKQSDCKTAIGKFDSYRQVNPSDPEALIYLNNAKALQQTQRLKIAVSVPIGSNPDVAKEILRGIAHAQNEVNNNGDNQGELLLVEIANDNNDPVQAEKIASQFVKDTSILAVVGHNTSDASLKAAPKYQLGGLVMIAPTGFSDSFSNAGTYIFRAIPRIHLSAVKLANYIITKVGITNIAICRDFRSLDNDSVRDHFVTAIINAGGKINDTYCDLSDDNLNADAKISEAISNGANALFLAPHIDRIDKAIKFAKAANQKGIQIFSSPTMYTIKTLEEGKADVNGMVLTTPWHPQAFASNSFAKNAQQLWSGTVNWRTATAYDATRAIITGLQQSKTKTRPELQRVLRSPNFSADGATGKIQFESSGIRKADFVLIKVQPSTQNSTGYDFVFVP
ncbi:MAG: ABC transporter substrate-binding protein [Nostoc sp.]|uniref:caspase, EACC1-associated type n=1 Tax=Nostoc sp. TaxID=1180 RepID=UPI002FF6E9A8